jgi:hypothetical protein
MPTWRVGIACCVTSATSCDLLPMRPGRQLAVAITRATPDGLRERQPARAVFGTGCLSGHDGIQRLPEQGSAPVR